MQPCANPFRHGKHGDQVQTGVLMLNLYDADMSVVAVKNASSPVKLQWPAPGGGGGGGGEGSECSSRGSAHNSSTNSSRRLDTAKVYCLHWSTHEEKWSKNGCWPMPSGPEVIRCECSHLTAFAGGFFVPPNTLDLSKDIALFLTVSSNPLVVSITGGIWCLYLISMIFAWRADRQKAAKVGAH